MYSQEKKRLKLTPDLVKESDEEAESVEESGGHSQGSSKAQLNDDNEYFFDLGKKRRVTIRKWKGNCYVDIREFYEDDGGALRPGKKGISLSVEQWKAIRGLVGDIDQEVERLMR